MKTKFRFLFPIICAALPACSSIGVFDVIQGYDKIRRIREAQKLEFSEAEEYYVGRKILADFFVSREPRFDRDIADYLNGVGQLLAAVSQRPDIWNGYRFILVDSPGLEAFSIPGGFIIVSTGLLRALDSEDELAAVLGHELAHAYYRHPLLALKKKIETEAKQDFVLFLGDRSDSTLLKIGSLVAAVNWENQLNNYSREQELEADAYSTWLMVRAGYDPQAMLGALAKLPRGKRDYSRLHPPVGKRIETVKKEIAGYPETPAAHEVRILRYKAEVLDRLAMVIPELAN